MYIYVEMAMRMQLLSLVPLEGCYWSVKTYSFVHWDDTLAWTRILCPMFYFIFGLHFRNFNFSSIYLLHGHSMIFNDNDGKLYARKFAHFNVNYFAL